MSHRNDKDGAIDVVYCWGRDVRGWWRKVAIDDTQGNKLERGVQPANQHATVWWNTGKQMGKKDAGYRMAMSQNQVSRPPTHAQMSYQGTPQHTPGKTTQQAPSTNARAQPW